MHGYAKESSYRVAILTHANLVLVASSRARLDQAYYKLTTISPMPSFQSLVLTLQTLYTTLLYSALLISSSSNMRFLCLHGVGTNSQVLETQSGITQLMFSADKRRVDENCSRDSLWDGSLPHL